MSALTGTGTLVRFFLRRDRFRLAAWITGGVALYVLTAVGVAEIYSTQAEFDAAAATMASNSAFIALAGPARVLNTVGGQVAWQAGVFGQMLAALMSMFLTGRHTRAEEESGRDELVRSNVVGRHAPLAAAIIVVTFANCALGAGISVGLIWYGLAAAGSIALGLAATCSGLVFLGVALLAAQLTENTRTMYGITGAAIGVSYVLRAMGDIGNGVLSWLSPLGWGQAMRAYDGEIWWPAALSAGVAVACTAIAFRIINNRDIGAGVMTTRAGPARAGTTLHSANGLAWRLQRGSLIGWSTGLFLTGLAYGSAGGDVRAVIGDSGISAVFVQGGGDLTDSFYATTALMMGLIASAFAISSASRLRAEEEAGRVENMLSTKLTRNRWVSSHVLMMLLGSALVLGVGGIGTGISYAAVSHDAVQIARIFGSAMVYLPAVWILGAVALALFGFVPRMTSAAWLALVYCVIIMLFGVTFRFPSWLMNVSPFVHLPLVPAADFDVVPVIITTVVALVGCAFGVFGFRRRDLQTT